MINPFKSLCEKNVSSEKKSLQKKISAKAWELTTLTVKGKAKNSDVDELELLYKKYFDKFPDKSGEISAKGRIAKLRQFVTK